jgi:glycosyltransferase involved in cell wall biosynthesis
LTEEELLTLFGESSAYIVTSLYEPFGLAPLEAALCGCAIIARDLPSMREVWEDAAVYFRTPEELSSHLNNLFAVELTLLAAQSAAKRRALHFTAQRMTTSYISLYEDLIARTDSHTRAQQELASHAA